VAANIQLTRTPTPTSLRVSTAGEATLQAAAAAAAAAARSCPCASDSPDSTAAGDCEGCGANGPAFTFLSSPSELASSINSINLAASIAKHKQWAN